MSRRQWERGQREQWWWDIAGAACILGIAGIIVWIRGCI